MRPTERCPDGHLLPMLGPVECGGGSRRAGAARDSWFVPPAGPVSNHEQLPANAASRGNVAPADNATGPSWRILSLRSHCPRRPALLPERAGRASEELPPRAAVLPAQWSVPELRGPRTKALGTGDLCPARPGWPWTGWYLLPQTETVSGGGSRKRIDNGKNHGPSGNRRPVRFPWQKRLPGALMKLGNRIALADRELCFALPRQSAEEGHWAGAGCRPGRCHGAGG